jgi:hypothetical protein
MIYEIFLSYFTDFSCYGYLHCARILWSGVCVLVCWLLSCVLRIAIMLTVYSPVRLMMASYAET